MEKISEALISKALDGLTLRQQYTAQNIANANTQNYRSVEVSFEENLRKASLSGNTFNITEVQLEVKFRDENSASSSVRLDRELATASQTAMRYSALIEILSRTMALNRAVIAANGR